MNSVISIYFYIIGKDVYKRQVYMSQMGAQLKLQFGLLIETREAQLEELASRTVPHPTEALEEVSAGRRRYGYSYLGLYLSLIHI